MPAAKLQAFLFVFVISARPLLRELETDMFYNAASVYTGSAENGIGSSITFRERLHEALFLSL